MHIRDLDLSSRAYNALWIAGVRTVGQLQRLDPRTIENLRGVGKHTYREIRDALATHQASPPEEPSNSSE